MAAISLEKAKKAIGKIVTLGTATAILAASAGEVSGAESIGGVGIYEEGGRNRLIFEAGPPCGPGLELEVTAGPPTQEDDTLIGVKLAVYWDNQNSACRR